MFVKEEKKNAEPNVGLRFESESLVFENFKI
mgnify:FL=1